MTGDVLEVQLEDGMWSVRGFGAESKGKELSAAMAGWRSHVKVMFFGYREHPLGSDPVLKLTHLMQELGLKPYKI